MPHNAAKPAKSQPIKPFNITASAEKIASFTASEGEGTASPKLASFEGNAYTGVPMFPEGYWTPIICELTGIKVSQQHRPVLRQHDHNQIVGHTETVVVDKTGVNIAGVMSGQPEHVEKVTVPAKNGFKWQLSIGATPTRTEFLEVGEETEVNGQKVTGPLVIARETELGEISFVPLGADGNTSATVTASRSTIMASKFHQALKVLATEYSEAQVDAMSEDEAKAALKKCTKASDDKDDDDKKDAKASRGTTIKASAEDDILAARKLHAEESARIAGIRAAVKSHGAITIKAGGKEVDLESHAISEGWSVEKTELESLRASRPTGNVNIIVPGNPSITDAVLECAVLQAARHEFHLDDPNFYKSQGHSQKLQNRITAEMNARYTDQVQQTAHTLFKGRAGLQQILVAAARTNGYRGPDVLRDDGDITSVLRASSGEYRYGEIRADGASTASIANVTANVMNKFLLQGYMFVEQAWREVAAIRSVTNFLPTKSINLFGDFVFEKVSDNGELKNATIQDQAFSNQADQYGKIITLGRKNIINDTIGALTTVPMQMGRGAGLKLNSLFWTTWLDSNQKDDGGSTAFWATTHTLPVGQTGNANLISGATTALSSTSLQSAKQKFDKQIDPNGNPLGVDAEILLYPVELDKTAWELCNSMNIVMEGLASTSTATIQPSSNRWVGKYRPVMSRYLSNSAITGYSTTAWYLLANPGVLPVFEACFLNGQDMPVVQQAGPDFQFNTLGLSFRGVFDFGVNYQNFRGGVKSAGA